MYKELMPKISVIMTTKNSAKYLERALKSLIDQNYPNYEIIAIDGLSTDGTVDIFNKYKEHIGFIRSEKDNGGPEIYKDGLKHATGDLIVFLNSDDFFEGKTLHKAAQAYLKDKNIMIFSCNTKFYKSLNNELILGKTYEGKQMLLTVDASLYRPFINSRFYNKEVFAKYGTLLEKTQDNKKFNSFDQELMIRFAIQQVPNIVLEDCYYAYTMHSGSITMSGNKKLVYVMIQEHLEIAENVLKHANRLSFLNLFKVLHWHAKNSVKSVIYATFFKEYKNGWKLFIRVLKCSNIFFLMKLLCRVHNLKKLLK